MSTLERAVAQAASLDELARRPTPLGRLDARMKVVATAAFVVTTASFERHDLSRPLPLLVLLAAALALGEVPWRILLGRVALGLPFALLVGLASPWLEPTPVLLGGGQVIAAGWLSCASILLRVVLGLTAIVVLVATTGFDAVGAALGRLGAPRALVTQLMLLHRYAFVVGAEAARMLRAHSLRAPDVRWPSLTTARSLLGALLLRSLARAEAVHAAMLCRGFTGEIRRPGAPSRVGGQDWGFLIGTVAALAIVRSLDLPAWIGGWFA